MRLAELGRSAADAVLSRAGRVAARFQEERGVDTDVLESADEFLVVFDAPGATATDVDVRYDRGAVHVTIDRFREFREEYETVVPGRGLSLDGRAELPPDAVVDPDGARAELRDDGTLYVFLPKVESEAGAGDVDVE
ncbi:MAG: Hsp20/alpha crystallin family protein [Halobacteriaceae archaeon]